VHRDDARRRLEALRIAVRETLALAQQGSLLRTGLHVVLAGRPNVGKSSLLNRLAGEEVAIVTAVPGTTRDTVRQAIQIEGVPLHLVDTAGLRETDDEVERQGIARTWSAIERADLLLMVLDARTGMTDDDRSAEARIAPGLPRVVVYNKIDLTGERPASARDGTTTSVRLSAKTGAGVDLLRKAILEAAGWRDDVEAGFVARERHLVALRSAAARLEAAERQLGAPELFAEEIRLAHDALNTITGEFTPDDLLGEIFARFCIGK
jgi:tRNA modification GTPase